MDSSSFDFESLPEDLQMQILSRLPLKSLVTCICVSKKWASLIRTKAFRDPYLHQSMTRPRVLFVAHDVRTHQNKDEALFHSVYQEEEPLLSSGQQQIRANEAEAPLDEVSQPIRGLICLRGGTNVVICNPGAKKFRRLPQIPQIQRPNGASITIRCFFGYDESTDVFKVLCITQLGDGKRTKEFHVYTVTGGSVEEDSPWRRITCNHDHSPVTQGLFKGGFLYYGAQSNISDKSLVMSFNVSSEDFTVIELPEDIVQLDHRWKLVNYYKDIALVNDSDFKTGIVDIYDDGIGCFVLWVRKEISGDWGIENIEIPQWLETVEHHMFVFNGTIGKTKLVFAPYCSLEGQIFVVYCHKDTKNLRRFEIEGMVDGYYNVRTFLNHVDSTWLI
ncbi:PREDICTED: putative F-box protein At1g70960 [Camelina sativa]|uniref:F-box protein At1g70960 n=1 Tax=Camelina sativa TaxID=90675 RepID=A0ABM0STC9_CAMSA|nr:PREDICTED: putative F-box protein At1g70960 [Camelina sativa]